MNKLATRSLASSALAKRSLPQPSFPVTATCPSPTCQCSPTPADLDIDRTKSLNGTMSPYAQHLIVSTGRKDWTSRIEDERDTAPWGRFTAEMKQVLGRGSEFHDPYNNILISTSSFTPWAQQKASDLTDDQASPEPTKVDALLFPAFKHLRSIASSVGTSQGTREETANPSPLIKDLTLAFLLPKDLHPIYKGIPEAERQAKTRDPSLAATLPIAVADITAPTILICSHGQRDSRCGILGPLLHREFEEYIDRHVCAQAYYPQVGTFTAAARAEASSGDEGEQQQQQEWKSSADPARLVRVPINIGTISHIGGHKWAGNVIVYIPPNATVTAQQAQQAQPHPHPHPHPHPLAGKGIWYGRVEPRHVQGIVEETVLRGNVIGDLFRGGVDRDGKVVRL